MTAPNPEGDVVLAPCPFCGGEGRLWPASGKMAVVGCAAGKHNCPAQPFGYLSEAEAIAAWNRRAAPAALQPSPAAPDGVREKVAAIIEPQHEAMKRMVGLGSQSALAKADKIIPLVLAAIPPVSGGLGAVAPLLPTAQADGAAVADDTERMFRQADRLNNALPGTLDDAAERLFKVEYPDRDYWSIKPDARLSWCRKAWEQAEPVAWIIDWRNKPSDGCKSPGGGSHIIRNQYAAVEGEVATLKGLAWVDTVTVTPLYARQQAAVSPDTQPGIAKGDEPETWASMFAWTSETFGPVTLDRVATRANEEMQELLADPSDVEEAADVIICLSRYPGIADAINRKMAINRARKWKLNGDGSGYHVKSAAPTTPAGKVGE